MQSSSPNGILRDASLLRAVDLAEVPSAEVLEQFLKDHGLPIETWAKDGKKDVKAFWKEIKLQESSLELWQKPDSSLQPVRTTHVLRAKVSSPERYERGIFVFNTWQQFESGTKRTRNGLLSEKLSMAEIPIEGNLQQVCQRAIDEEMQCLVSSTFKVSPTQRPPVFDPSRVSPKVVDQKLVDHTLEIELSKSFPGLPTVYHLYTVDIVCSGMPQYDFNTLEFKEADANGQRRLKYVHAWVWLEWHEIRRYLFEGSKIVERVTKDSFSSADGLRTWLSRLVDLSMWGRKRYRSVEDLYQEVQKQQTDLELWSRHDGVPLLMRVVHLMQVKVSTANQIQEGRFLFQTWLQSPDRKAKDIHRFLALKLSMKDLPLDALAFDRVVRVAVVQELTYLVDAHFQLDKAPVNVDDLEPSGVKVKSLGFVGHRIDVEESPSYAGMPTLYHIYTAEVVCENLPDTNFASIETKLIRPAAGGPRAVEVASVKGWVWATWQECLDLIHSRSQEISRNLNASATSVKIMQNHVTESQHAAARLSDSLQRLTAKLPIQTEDSDAKEAWQLLQSLRSTLDTLAQSSRPENGEPTLNSLIKRLPPQMIANMAENALTKSGETALERIRSRYRTTETCLGEVISFQL